MTLQIDCSDLVKIFSAEGVEVQALQGLTLRVDSGDMVAVVGASGSGKSTLLNVLSGLDQPSAGRATVAGHDMLGMSRAERVTFQRTSVGFVWQQTARNLLPYLSAAENIALAMSVAGTARGAARKTLVDEHLGLLGVGDVRDRLPDELSGGQQQRVAIARALTQRAEVILADEPIASLDPESARKVMEILADINRTDRKTVVVTLHQVDYAVRYCPRAVALKGGRIHYDGLAHGLSSQFLNDLYGADVDTSLMISEEGRRTAQPPKLALARV